MKIIVIMCFTFFTSIFGMQDERIQVCGPDYCEKLSRAIRSDNQALVESLFALSHSAWTIEHLLSRNKLDPNEQSAKGHVLVHWATRASNSEILEVLLKDPRTHPDIKNKNGCTALGFAVAQGKVLPTQLLLKYQANPNIINENKENEGDHHSILHSGVMGYCTMGISYRVSYFSIIKSLLSNAKTLVNQQDINGKTPLHYSVLLGNTALVNLFLCCDRVDQGIKDNDNKTALDYARETNKQRLINMLLGY